MNRWHAASTTAAIVAHAGFYGATTAPTTPDPFIREREASGTEATITIRAPAPFLSAPIRPNRAARRDARFKRGPRCGR